MVTVPIWADRISVQKDADTLIVRGEGRRRALVPLDKIKAEYDFLRQYSQFTKSVQLGIKRSGKLPPHIQFANCKTDQELIDFVQRFGPVWAGSGSRESGDGTVSTAIQSLPELRCDHLMFVGAVKLAAGLGAREMNMELAEGLRAVVSIPHHWPGETVTQTEPRFKERDWYGFEVIPFSKWLMKEVRKDGVKDWSDLASIADGKLRKYARTALCILLNSFPAQLTPTLDGFFEMPLMDQNGILPVLYFMLRQDILRDQTILMCARTGCGALFAVERYGQRFCSDECSLAHRQKEYWQRKGKNTRRSRIARKRSSRKRS